MGSTNLALHYCKELIATQRQVSKPEHIAKSLCDLAQFAKKLGSPELQSEFASKAVAEAPGDAWSYATLGDAYRALTDYQKSLTMYHTAGVLGDPRVALNGRAEVLKDLGQVEDAIKIYEQCVKNFPDDIVSRNGRAAAFAYYGKFQQALDAYDDILRQQPFDPVTASGRAQVLREMGRLDEAFEEFSALAKNYPEDLIQQSARAEVLRELGKVKEAEKCFADLVEHFPLSSQVLYSHARILRDLGLFSQSINEHKKNINLFPLSPWSYIGIADTYKKIGNLTEALRAYDLAISKFPHQGAFLSRNGKASVLVAMGDYANALNILPSNLPASQGEWVAYHIRGLVYMRSGDLSKAEKIFEWGSTECPWPMNSEYFKTSLASLRIQQKRYHEVAPLVQKIINPSIEPIACALVMHASGELGDTPLFNESYKCIKDIAAPAVIELRDALAKRYRHGETSSTPPDNWFFTQECDSLLLAA